MVALFVEKSSVIGFSYETRFIFLRKSCKHGTMRLNFQLTADNDKSCAEWESWLWRIFL